MDDLPWQLIVFIKTLGIAMMIIISYAVGILMGKKLYQSKPNKKKGRWSSQK
jgi:membrane protein DedA with SNARE-associated domain